MLKSRTAALRSAAVLVPLLLVSLLACQSSLFQKAKGALGRAELPDMGPKLPLTIKVEIDPGLTNTRLPYINVCNAPLELRVGEELEAVLLQAAGQNFRAVQLAGTPASAAKPDATVQISLQQSSLRVHTDNVYDRLPAELNLEAILAFKDPSGKLLGERLIKTSYKERLIVEPTQHRCHLVSIESFAANASVSLAVQFIREARSILDPEGSLASPGLPAAASPSGPVPPPMAPAPTTAGSEPMPPAPAPAAPPHAGPSLSFKAALFDENGNAVLEGGEQLKLRVDVVNAGLAPAVGVKVRVSGTPAVIDHFPADTLPLGDLQAGEARSVTFMGTLPSQVPSQQAEVIVAVLETSNRTQAAPQTVTASIRGGAEKRTGRAPAREAETVTKRRPVPSADDVDNVPMPADGYTQPHALLLAIGIGTYRDEQIPHRKFSAQDAELVAEYFEALGGIPRDNVRILQDRQALRSDIEEALLDWLPTRVTPESVVIVYFSGQAMTSPTGDVYLVPHDGARSATARLYALKELQTALSKLKTQLTLLIFDGSVLRVTDETKGGKRKDPASPQWEAGPRNIVRLIGSTGFQAGLEPNQLRHGLFTYYLLRGLRGEADENQDGEVTLGELAAFLTDSVPLAAKDRFRHAQQPRLIPSLNPSSRRASLPLVRPSDGPARQ
jgi:hypothetical protein